jgi:hypothetical protein
VRTSCKRHNAMVHAKVHKVPEARVESARCVGIGRHSNLGLHVVRCMQATQQETKQRKTSRISLLK